MGSPEPLRSLRGPAGAETLLDAMPVDARSTETTLLGRIAARPLWQGALLLGAAHLMLALGMLIGSLVLSGGFDAEKAVLLEPLMEVVLGLTAALFQPGMAVWGAVEVEARGADGLEWTVVVLNSLLWGTGIALLVRARRARAGT